jgi:hypothetical protein
MVIESDNLSGRDAAVRRINSFHASKWDGSKVKKTLVMDLLAKL